MKNILILFLIIILSSCNGDRTYDPNTVEIHTYTITHINRPKHFYLDLVRDDGKKFKKFYISKHCNAWRDIKIGDTVKMTSYVYWWSKEPNDKRIYYKKSDIKDCLCYKKCL